MANSNSSKPRGKRPRKCNNGNGRTNTRSEETKMGNLKKEGYDNDPNWYFTSSELANQAAELSFQEMLGTGPIMGSYEVPSLSVLYMNPSPGNNYRMINTDPDLSVADNLVPGSAYPASKYDGINLAAQKMYTLLSTYSGRTSSYAPQDLAFMILAIGEVAAISEHIRRAFGIALTYNMRNRTLPLAVLKRLGFDPDDLTAKLPEYRMEFNVQMTRINQIPLLDNIGYIRKCRDMYQKIYLDNPSNMAQMYAYAPATTWILDESSSPEGSVLRSTDACLFYNGQYVWDSVAGLPAINNRTMYNWLSLLQSMINNLLSSSTLNIIYADLLNLASKISVPLWQFDYLAENYVVMPEYNAAALLQIHNLDIIGKPSCLTGSGSKRYVEAKGYKFTNANDVVEDPGANMLIYNPVFLTTRRYTAEFANAGYHEKVVDMLQDNPTLEDRLESMRFSAIRSGYHAQFDVDYYTDIMQPATTVTGMTCDCFVATPDHYCVAMSMGTYIEGVKYIDLGTMQNEVYESTLMSIMSQFNLSPILYFADGEDYYNVDSVYGDLNFYTLIDYRYISRLNRMIYQGLFEFRV